MTSVGLDTLRAWERRYGAVVPERTDRGRMYSRTDIARLRLLRQLVERGHGIGRIAALPMAELEQRLLATETVAPASSSDPASSDPVMKLADMFTRFDDVGAGQELSRLAVLLAPRALVMEILLPLARQAGIRWERGEMGVAQEHLVSSAMRNMLGAMVRIHPPAADAPRMVLATLPGELHELGLLSAAMLAATSGWSPLYLGPNLPEVEIARAVREVRPTVVVIGNSGNQTRSETVAALAGLLPPEAALWIGGYTPQSDQSALPSGIVLIPSMEQFEQECLAAIS